MRTVYKYPLTNPVIEMPAGGKVVTVDIQNGQPCLWAEVDPTAKKMEKRRFHVYGTGNVVEGKYVGTYFEGPFIWHVYEH